MHFPAFNVASLARPLLSLTQASAPLDAGWPWSPSTALPQTSLSILQLLACPPPPLLKSSSQCLLISEDSEPVQPQHYY